MTLSRDALLMKLGAARSQYPSAWRLVDLQVHDQDRELHLPSQSRQTASKSAVAKAAICCAPISPAEIPPSCGVTTSSSRRSKRPSRISKATSPIRPIYHQLEQRIEAHIFIAFLALLPARHAGSATAPACARAERRAACSTNSPPCRCSMSHIPTTDGANDDADCVTPSRSPSSSCCWSGCGSNCPRNHRRKSPLLQAETAALV